MPLVSIRDEMKRAQRGRYAIPCFDTLEMMSTQGIITALEEKKAPGIVGVYSGSLDGPNARGLATMVRVMAEDATVPISMMLDHGADMEHCLLALSYGFSDIMYDGSKLPLEENIANTRTVVRAAHAVGAAVEAELGHVGLGHEYREFGARSLGFTDPELVERFISETNVDFLAVAVGTAHGLYSGEPALDLELLDEIRKRVEIPLVLHGGSGLSDEQFTSAIEHGICKINIYTNLAMAGRESLAEALELEEVPLEYLMEALSRGIQCECTRLLDVFGTSGKAQGNPVQAVSVVAERFVAAGGTHGAAQ